MPVLAPSTPIVSIVASLVSRFRLVEIADRDHSVASLYGSSKRMSGNSQNSSGLPRWPLISARMPSDASALSLASRMRTVGFFRIRWILPATVKSEVLKMVAAKQI